MDRCISQKYKSQVMDLSKLKVGVIGTGNIAVTAHLPIYKKHSDEVEVVAIAGISEESVKQLASEYGISRTFTDYHHMLRDVELDLVSVCTPNNLHAPVTIAALKAGCHVFCEKPPALSVEELTEMKRVAEEKNRLLSFNFHHRFSPEVEVLKKYIDNDEFGDIYSSRIHALRRRGIPGWGSFTDKNVQGGGPLIDIGIHMLDVCLYLMGYPTPETVLGVTHSKIGSKKGVGLMGPWDPEKFSVEDLAVAMIRFENGASLTIETSFALNMEEKSVMNVHLFGEKAGATVFPPKVFHEKHDTLVNTEIPYLVGEDKYEKSLYSFIRCCINNVQPTVTLEESMIVQKLINGIYQSAQTGEAIQL